MATKRRTTTKDAEHTVADNISDFRDTAAASFQSMIDFQMESSRSLMRNLLTMHQQMLQAHLEAVAEQVALLDRLDADLQKRVA